MLARRLFMSHDSEDPMVTGDYFYIEALTDGVTISLDATDIEYNLNDGAGWIGLTAGSTSRSVSSGERIYIRANGVPTRDGIGTFTISNSCIIGGNIMSLLFSDDFEGKTSLTGYDYAFYKLFYRAPIIYASDLLLPATILASYCYSSMFYNCTELRDVPELPATTLAGSCYRSMFYGCKQLKVAPALPATTLAFACYDEMFYNCSLIIAPELPATTLAPNCYGGMFHGCNFSTAPKLPATTIEYGCYSGMFAYCMFLTKAPDLPATQLTSYCYAGMFRGCFSLTTAPKLPVTTLYECCYRYMFIDCTSLTTAPELPATTLASGCYEYMFQGCTNLNYIKMLATDVSARVCLNNWVSGVASSGTFVKNSAMTSLPTGTRGIPEGWTVIDA